jgi:photosystem II stability/assembly factor-like uncharacterized protein
MLPSSTDCWEPAIAVGPRDQVYIVAGHRTAPGSATFDQKQVLWRSRDGGVTFEGPWTVTTDGHREADQRIAVDRNGTIYVTYMDHADLDPASPVRLRLVRSHDEGRTFTAETIPVTRVSDKPELAVSPDGQRIAVVYESGPGPTIVTTADGGKTWNDARLVEPGGGRHFWPEALTFAPDGALWFAVPSMSDAAIQRHEQTDAQLHVYRSTDDGHSWQDSRISSSPRFLKGCAHDPDCRVRLPGVGVAIDRDGQAYVAYTEGSGPGQPYALMLTSSADDGRTWSAGRNVSAAPRPQSKDRADHDFVLIAAARAGRVCVVWADDRRGARDTFARCSTDGAKTWGDDIWLSNRTDGAPYKSPEGFAAVFGHYGGAALSSNGCLFVVWAEGERDYRTGTVWFNSMLNSPGPRRPRAGSAASRSRTSASSTFAGSIVTPLIVAVLAICLPACA